MDSYQRSRYANFEEGYENPKRLVPKIGMKFSDEDPRYRTVNEYHSITRKRKLFISDKSKKATSELPEAFSVEINFDTKNVRYIKPIQVQVTYTKTAASAVNGFLHFPDFNNAELTANGQKYHAYFPIIQGSIGSQVLFNHIFTTDYITEFKELNNIRDKLRVEVFKENTDGTISAFTELDAFAVELELNYVDHAFRHDKQAVF